MKKFSAELIGTFVLVFIGSAAAVISAKAATPDAPSGIGLLGVALAFGGSVTTMAYAIGPISGCHINPAITVSMLVARKISAADAAGYIVSQFIGATLAAGLLYTIQSGLSGFTMGEYALCSTGWGPDWLRNYSTQSAFIAEAVLTFIFLIVIFATTSKRGNATMAPLAIGLTLVLIHLAAIPITGASVNPARSFGPAIFAGGKALQQLWLYLIAPVVGGVAAALVWSTVFASRRDDEAIQNERPAVETIPA